MRVSFSCGQELKVKLSSQLDCIPITLEKEQPEEGNGSIFIFYSFNSLTLILTAQTHEDSEASQEFTHTALSLSFPDPLVPLTMSILPFMQVYACRSSFSLTISLSKG